jgi:succinate dehydrogenase / fumarate reductase flavoprotein subunit
MACLRRTESRGAHFRLDYPKTDDKRWRSTTRVQSDPNGTLEFFTDPLKESTTFSAQPAVNK